MEKKSHSKFEFSNEKRQQRERERENEEHGAHTNTDALGVRSFGGKKSEMARERSGMIHF